MSDRSVAVVGGGPAGCSAGVFLARYGFEVTVFDRGNASLQQCAFLGNYLGFPAGIDVGTFRDLATDHAEHVGCTVVPERVTGVDDVGEQFRVTTDEDRSAAFDYVVAASALDGSYLTGVADGALADADGEFDPGRVDADGGTAVAGIYVAGPLAGVPSQVSVAAGHGARAALALLTDHRRAVRGLWEEAARAADWTVEQGRHEGEDWEQATRNHYAETAPDELDDDVVAERIRELIREFQEWEIDETEVERHRSRAHERLAAHLDGDAVAAAADPVDVVAEHGVDAVRRALTQAADGSHAERRD